MHGGLVLSLLSLLLHRSKPLAQKTALPTVGWVFHIKITLRLHPRHCPQAHVVGILSRLYPHRYLATVKYAPPHNYLATDR